MRILLLNDGSTPVGGAELQTLRLRQLLRDRGHEVRLLSSTASELGTAPLADATCFGTTHPKGRVLTQTVNPMATRALRREVARFRPDVVHVRMFLTQLSPAILPVLRSVPTVWQVVFYKAICPRGTKVLPDGSPCSVRPGSVCLRNRCVTAPTWAADMVQLRLWRRWAGDIDAVVALSESVRDQLERHDVSVARVIGNGIAPRPSRPALRDPVTIAFAGRLVHEKGVDLLIRAFGRLASEIPDVRLLIAGDGPERSALESLADRLGISARTEFTGHLDRPELEERLDDAWVQVVPGRWAEPFGNVVLEAMMRGTALVVTDCGGPAEVVRDGRTGLVVEPGSEPALTAALRSLVTDRQRCERLGAAGRDAAVQVHTEKAVVTQFEELYEDIRRRAGRHGR